MNADRHRHRANAQIRSVVGENEGKADEMNSRISLDEFGGEYITGGTDDVPDVDPLVVNKLLADELKQLSIDRREQVLEEIHGVQVGGGVSLQSDSGANSDLTRQQQEEIALRKFQDELDRYYFSEPTQGDQNSSKGSRGSSTDQNYSYPAYRYARENGSELIKDRDFQLTFFGRGEGGTCPKRGAKRMLNYLEFVRQIYDTDDVLFRPICLADLNEEMGSKEFMNEVAPLQMLPLRDPSGRRVLVHLRDFGPSSCPTLVRQQVGMYFAQTIGEDQDGMVFVSFLHSHHNIYHAEEFRNFSKMIETIPPKFSAVHLCFPEGQLYEIAKAAFTLFIGKENRQRLRLHVGSYQECKYSLRSFGIPVGRLPVDLVFKGRNSKRKQVDLRNHKKWLCMREAKEAAMFADIGRDSHGRILEDNIDGVEGSFKGVMAAVREIRSKFVECPRHEDCLFGKGRPAMYHPGNIAMRKLLEAKIDRFESMVPLQKSVVVWEVVNEIKRGTGRFLKEDTDHAGLFVITDDETAFKKIAIAFRDLKKRRLRVEEQRDVVGKTAQRSLPNDKEKQDLMPSNVRGRKRPATSAAQSSVIRSDAFSSVATGLEVNMSLTMSMNMNMNNDVKYCLEDDEDVVSKQKKRLQDQGCIPKFF